MSCMRGRRGETPTARPNKVTLSWAGRSHRRQLSGSCRQGDGAEALHTRSPPGHVPRGSRILRKGGVVVVVWVNGEGFGKARRKVRRKGSLGGRNDAAIRGRCVLSAQGFPPARKEWKRKKK